MQQQQDMIASLVTCYIANYAGKVAKRPLSVKDIFPDRHGPKITEADLDYLKEIMGGSKNG